MTVSFIKQLEDLVMADVEAQIADGETKAVALATSAVEVLTFAIALSCKLQMAPEDLCEHINAVYDRMGFLDDELGEKPKGDLN